MDKEINNNDYDYIDLDLPSGTLWAAQNVGANKPSEYGLYFQWGDTVGYTKEQAGKDKQFNWNDYKWSIDGSDSNFNKYTTTGATLDLEDDAAHTNMGGDWHMPTYSQILELIGNAIFAWTTLDGVSGMTFTSKKDASKSIFIPAAGNVSDGIDSGREGYGYVWSSMQSTYHIHSGQNFIVSSKDASVVDGVERCYGFSVRGVIG